MFFDAFGRRGNSYLVLVMFWPWWLMVAGSTYCHFRHREPHDFAVAFFNWFASGWLLVLAALGFTALACLIPRVGLLEDLRQPPAYMQVVTAVSWCLPVAVLLFAVLCRRRFRTGNAKDDDPVA